MTQSKQADSPYNCRYTVDYYGNISGDLNRLRLPGELAMPIRKKVSIVGFEQAYTPTAPMDDPAYEIWGLNHANRLGFMVDSQGRFRADRWFDLHQRHAQSEADLAWIDTCRLPIYLTDKFTENSYAVVYPVDVMSRHYKLDYFCSSFAYMLVLACWIGFSEIRLDGINLSYGRERLVERGNLEYWIGRLQGEGYNIVIPESSTLLTHPYRYGFDYTEEKEAVEHLMAVSVLECLNDRAVRDIVPIKIADLLRQQGMPV